MTANSTSDVTEYFSWIVDMLVLRSQNFELMIGRKFLLQTGKVGNVPQ